MCTLFPSKCRKNCAITVLIPKFVLPNEPLASFVKRKRRCAILPQSYSQSIYPVYEILKLDRSSIYFHL